MIWSTTPSFSGCLATPLCLDESIHSPEDARKGLQLGSGRVINIKVGRVRGHLAGAAHPRRGALAFRRAGLVRGDARIRRIGRAHNLHLSSLPGFYAPRRYGERVALLG